MSDDLLAGNFRLSGFSRLVRVAASHERQQMIVNRLAKFSPRGKIRLASPTTRYCGSSPTVGSSEMMILPPGTRSSDGA